MFYPRLVLPSLALLLCGPLSAAATPLHVSFAPGGLSSIKSGDREFVAVGTPSVQRVADASGKVVQSKLQSSNFDPATKTLTQVYPWGSMSVRYEPLSEVLRLHVRLENKEPEPLSALNFVAMQFKNLGDGRAPQPTYGFEEPHFTFFEGSEGSVVLGVIQPKFPAMLDMVLEKSGNISARVGLGGGKLIGDGVLMDQMLEPGKPVELTLELRVGSDETPAMTLAQPFLDEFRKAHPSILEWPDRRPIFRAFFGGGIPVKESLENLKNPEAVQPPPPDETFHANLTNKVDNIITAAKAGNAQGVILWDLEGETFPHATTYIGDPRHIRLLNPQMDLFADEIFKKLTDAGLKTGVTLRPSRVIYDAEKNNARHSYADAKDPLLELSGKIDYAKKRWGCTLFYVDTNYFWRPYGAEKKWQAAPINSEVWRQLRTKYPDTLFIPEFAGIGDYASTAGYGEADMGNYGVPVVAKALYPDSFRVIVIEDADASENFDRFVGALKEKNVLMTFGQGEKSFNTQMIVRMNEWLGLVSAAVPPMVENATGAGLKELLQSADQTVVFQAARKLAESPLPDAAPRLLELVQSEESPWPVRRAAVLALAAIDYEPAIPVLMELMSDRTLGLYGDAAKALAVQDASVELLVVEKLGELMQGSGMQRGIDRFGSILVLRNASSQAKRLQEFYATISDKDNNARREVLEIIGRLKNPDSQEFLLPLLSDPQIGPAAGAALVRIGTPEGIQAVKSAQTAAQKEGNKELAGALGRALQAK